MYVKSATETRNVGGDIRPVVLHQGFPILALDMTRTDLIELVPFRSTTVYP